MSDTPRTDAESCWLFEGLSEVVTADFARGLERELAEAKRDAERWAELIEAAKEVDRIGVGGHLRLCKALDAMRGE